MNIQFGFVLRERRLTRSTLHAYHRIRVVSYMTHSISRNRKESWRSKHGNQTKAQLSRLRQRGRGCQRRCHDQVEIGASLQRPRYPFFCIARKSCFRRIASANSNAEETLHISCLSGSCDWQTRCFPPQNGQRKKRLRPSSALLGGGLPRRNSSIYI
jgi:hypothetical protein